MLRQILVVFVTPHAVGVSFHRNIQAGVREYDAGNFGQPFARSSSQFEASNAEQHARHVRDQSAGGVARRQDRVQFCRMAVKQKAEDEAQAAAAAGEAKARADADAKRRAEAEAARAEAEQARAQAEHAKAEAVAQQQVLSAETDKARAAALQA